MAMTIETLCEKCSALNKEFNTSARHMDGTELASFRKKLMMKYDVGFENGWTVRLCRRISDTFTVSHVQVWTQTGKGLFGKSRVKKKMHLTLTAPLLPELMIKCVSTDAALADGLQSGDSVRVSGELELSVFLHGEGMQWQSAEFLKGAKAVRV